MLVTANVPLDKSTAEALTIQGVTLAKQGDRIEAMAAFRRALVLAPHYPKAHHNLGVALAEEAHFEEAVRCFEEALRLQPNYVDALANLGSAHHKLRNFDKAAFCFRKALKLRPANAELLNNLGLCLVFLGHPGEAQVLLQHSVRLRPDFREAHNNLGLALTEAGDFLGAATCFERTLALDPRYAEAHSNLGNNFREQGRLPEALACYDLALALEPKAISPRWNRALALLEIGDYERGWAEYETRLKKPGNGIRSFTQPAWDGSPLDGRTILIHMEQGLGDMIQFIRYAPLVAQFGGKVVVSCPTAVRSLFARCAGIDQVVDERGELPPFDVQVPLLSLPALLRTKLATVPAEIPYLSASDDLVVAWKERLADVTGFRVGIAWQGNPRYQRDRHRSVPLPQFEPLTRVPGVRLVSLQRGHGTDQLDAQREVFPVVATETLPGPDAATFLDTAALMQNLDLIVCVDTSVAHLAGSLGLPTWIALPCAADSRWLLRRTDTPWYPSVRLFRQKQWGDWDGVFAGLATELARTVDRRIRTPRPRIDIEPGEFFDILTRLQLEVRHPQNGAASRALELARREAERDCTLSNWSEAAALVDELRQINAREEELFQQGPDRAAASESWQELLACRNRRLELKQALNRHFEPQIR